MKYFSYLDYFNEGQMENEEMKRKEFEKKRKQQMKNTTSGWYANSERSQRPSISRPKKGGTSLGRKSKGTIRFDPNTNTYHEELNPINNYLNTKDYSNIYLCSDIHFFKPEIKNKENKTKNLMNNFKKQCDKLTEDDILIYLGDLSHRECTPEMNKELQKFLKSCNCTKFLILGNHDILNKDYYKKCGFNYIDNKLIFDNIIFTHIPIDINKYKLDGVKYNIHGHIHGNKLYYEVDPKGHFDVFTKNHIFLNLNDIMNNLIKKGW